MTANAGGCVENVSGRLGPRGVCRSCTWSRRTFGFGGENVGVELVVDRAGSAQRSSSYSSPGERLIPADACPLETR